MSLETNLQKSLAFTPTKDYSPKRQFFWYSFSIHYGVKFKYLTTCETVSIETPSQHSIYDIYELNINNFVSLFRMAEQGRAIYSI